MSIQKIRQFPHPILSRSCQSILPSDPKFPSILKDLEDTLKASPGVGLAAPQIGVAFRVSLIDLTFHKKKGGGGKTFSRISPHINQSCHS